MYRVEGSALVLRAGMLGEAEKVDLDTAELALRLTIPLSGPSGSRATRSTCRHVVCFARGVDPRSILDQSLSSIYIYIYIYICNHLSLSLSLSLYIYIGRYICRHIYKDNKGTLTLRATP